MTFNSHKLASRSGVRPRALRDRAVCFMMVLAGCSDRADVGEDELEREVNRDGGTLQEPPAEPSPMATLTVVTQDAPDLPLAGLSEQWRSRFFEGDANFDKVFRAPQGLGPIYIRQSCASCHTADARGPGAARKMVRVEADGYTPSEDQSMFPYGHTVRPQSTDPSSYPGVSEPEPFDGLLVSSRLGPAVFGRGAMEAILDSEIERLEAEQSKRTDGISGRINRVTYESEFNPESQFRTFEKGEQGLIGRFGLKARITTLDEFAADAYQGDMGITSPLRPTELPNPAGAQDDAFAGVDIDLDTVNATGDYVRLLRIPARRQVNDASALESKGSDVFDEVSCSVCHARSLATDPSYAIEQWAGIEAEVFTDLLLHAMGRDLADGMTDGNARGDEWRTAPLLGVRHLRSLMHDGRASNVREAILAHASEGSEANASVEAFLALSEDEQTSLVAFVESL